MHCTNVLAIICPQCNLHCYIALCKLYIVKKMKFTSIYSMVVKSYLSGYSARYLHTLLLQFMSNHLQCFGYVCLLQLWMFGQGDFKANGWLKFIVRNLSITLYLNLYPVINSSIFIAFWVARLKVNVTLYQYWAVTLLLEYFGLDIYMTNFVYTIK